MKCITYYEINHPRGHFIFLSFVPSCLNFLLRGHFHELTRAVRDKKQQTAGKHLKSFLKSAIPNFPTTVKKTTVEVGLHKWVRDGGEEMEGAMGKGRQTDKVGDGGLSPLCTWVIFPCLICSDRLPSMLWAALNCCRKHTRALTLAPDAFALMNTHQNNHAHKCIS